MIETHPPWLRSWLRGARDTKVGEWEGKVRQGTKSGGLRPDSTRQRCVVESVKHQVSSSTTHLYFNLKTLFKKMHTESPDIGYIQEEP